MHPPSPPPRPVLLSTGMDWSQWDPWAGGLRSPTSRGGGPAEGCRRVHPSCSSAPPPPPFSHLGGDASPPRPDPGITGRGCGCTQELPSTFPPLVGVLEGGALAPAAAAAGGGGHTLAFQLRQPPPKPGGGVCVSSPPPPPAGPQPAPPRPFPFKRGGYQAGGGSRGGGGQQGGRRRPGRGDAPGLHPPRGKCPHAGRGHQRCLLLRRLRR